MTRGIVIVGAGYCGVSAAFAAREAGYDRAITVIGDDPEWPYERPPLSKWDGAAPVFRTIVAPEAYAAQGIALRRGERVASISAADRLITLETGERLPYDKLLLATGARPRRLEPTAPAKQAFHTLRSIADARLLAERIGAGDSIILIGGGFIGLELAASLTKRDAQVHVIETQDRILARVLPAEISAAVHALHADHGVTLHTRSSVASFQEGVVVLTDGSSLKADHVIVGIGSVPNTELAEQAGLQVENGIVVDDRFNTSAPHIFAAGDCAAAPVAEAGRLRQESWEIAGEQGRRAGQILAGVTPDPATPSWFWSDQYDHSLQVVGTPVAGTTPLRRPQASGTPLCIDHLPDGRIAQAAGIAPGHKIGRDIKILQRLIAAQTRISAEALVDPDITLKSLLRSSVTPS